MISAVDLMWGVTGNKNPGNSNQLSMEGFTTHATPPAWTWGNHPTVHVI